MLRSFKLKGYTFSVFDDFLDCDAPQKDRVILRHDIDFCIRSAFEIAKLEYSLGIRSTFFIMLSTVNYNLIAPEYRALVRSIESMRHVISLHFDPTAYSDVTTGLREEISIFKNLFGVDVNTISLHRPSKHFLGNESFRLGESCSIHHTYQPRFFERIKYISDSQGEFRFGHPLQSSAFLNNQSIHLLLHPIWWTYEGETPIQKIESFLNKFNTNHSIHIENNCKPWKNQSFGKQIK